MSREETFYCNECNKDVVLKNGKCPNCGTNWKEIIDGVGKENAVSINNTVKEALIMSKEDKKNEKEDLMDTYDFFISKSKIISTILYIFAIVFLIVALFLFQYEEFVGYGIFFIVAMILTAYKALIIEKEMKWKGYVLKLLFDTRHKNK